MGSRVVRVPAHMRRIYQKAQNFLENLVKSFVEDLGGDEHLENIARDVAAHYLFSTLSAFVFAKVLQERFVQCFSSVLVLLLDPPLFGPGILTTLGGRQAEGILGLFRPGPGGSETLQKWRHYEAL